MSQARELARLNLVLEMVSECAALSDIDSLIRIIAGRLRWILDFESCELALRFDDAVDWHAMRLSDDTFSRVDEVLEGSGSHSLMREALKSGVPTSAGLPISSIAVPLGSSDVSHGVLCIRRLNGSFTQRELRLVHHIASSIGAVLSRIGQERVIGIQRQKAAMAAEEARREKFASDELTASNNAKDSFMAMLGHELRNPLSPILAATMLLSREVEGKPLTRVKIIERQARQLDRLVSDLLDVSRITSGKVSLKRAVMDVSTVITKAIEMARPGIEAKDQTLTAVLPEQPVVIDGDEARLAQVFSNLLNNASSYSGKGKAIRVSLTVLATEVVVAVEDEGIGMAPETISKIFGLYVQGGRSKEWAPGGLGLGLAVANALVQLHHGTIVAESQGEELGSRFTVRLPLLQVTPAAVESLMDRDPVAGAVVKRRVLVVDDNTDAADALAELLTEQGHDVRVAYEPLKALTLAAEFAPQIAILDIGMPVMDGHELAASLRQQPSTASTRFFALSGYGQEADRQRSLQSGFEAHFVKPANLPDITQAIGR
jgi:signal transduction histidine kinase